MFLIIKAYGLLGAFFMNSGYIFLYPSSHVLWKWNIVIDVYLLLAWSISLKCSYILYLFLLRVWPTYCLPQVWHVMQYITFAVLQLNVVKTEKVHHICGIEYYVFCFVEDCAIFAKGCIAKVETTYLDGGSKWFGFRGGFLGGFWYTFPCVILLFCEEVIHL